MSHFYCPDCGMLLIDTDRGYISGCSHRPADIPFDRLTRREKMLVRTAEAECSQKSRERETQ